MDDPGNLARRMVAERALAFNTLGHPAILDEFILKHGEPFYKHTEGKVLRKIPKECYSNAARLAIENESLLYTEGYACSKKYHFPFLHAWIMSDGERIVDNTLEHPNDYSYFGISFQHQFLLEQLVKYKVYGILGGMPEQAVDLIKLHPHLWKHHGSIRRSA